MRNFLYQFPIFRCEMETSKLFIRFVSKETLKEMNLDFRKVNRWNESGTGRGENGRKLHVWFVSRTRRSVVQAVCLSLDNYQIKDGYWINRTSSILLCGIYQKIFLQTDTHSLPNHWIDGIQMSMKMYTYNCEKWINPIDTIHLIWISPIPCWNLTDFEQLYKAVFTVFTFKRTRKHETLCSVCW